MRKLLRRGNFSSVADLEAKLRQFLAYFNQTMAHPFNWTYNGKPLAKTRSAKFFPPHRRSSLSQIALAKKALACVVN